MFQTFCPLHGRNGLRSVAAAGIDALAQKEFKPLDQRQHQQPLHMAWLARGKGHHWWLHWSYELTSVDYRIYIRVQKIDGKMESYWNALLKVISAVLFFKAHIHHTGQVILSFIGTCTEAKTWSPSWVRHSFRHSASNCQAFEAQVNLFRSHQNLADFLAGCSSSWIMVSSVWPIPISKTTSESEISPDRLSIQVSRLRIGKISVVTAPKSNSEEGMDITPSSVPLPMNPARGCVSIPRHLTTLFFVQVLEKLGGQMSDHWISGKAD